MATKKTPPKKAAKKKKPIKKKLPQPVIQLPERPAHQFQPENVWWKMRSKIGREQLFAEPQDMLEEAEQYFVKTDGRKWVKKELVKGGLFAGQIMDVPTETPYTWEGLCRYLNCNTHYFNDFRAKIKEMLSKKDLTPEERLRWDAFSEVVTRIGEIIRQQKYEGAVVGTFNHNIIARDLGLVDKKENGFRDKDGNPTDPPKGVIITNVMPNTMKDL